LDGSQSSATLSSNNCVPIGPPPSNCPNGNPAPNGDTSQCTCAQGNAFACGGPCAGAPGDQNKYACVVCPDGSTAYGVDSCPKVTVCMDGSTQNVVITPGPPNPGNCPPYAWVSTPSWSYQICQGGQWVNAGSVGSGRCSSPT
jgi:hypothetical protein